MGHFTELPIAPFDERVLSQVIEDAMTTQRIPGLSLAIRRGGELLFSRGLGVRRLGEPGAVNERTCFHSASISKTVTAAAVMKLLGDADRIVSTPIRDLLPEFRMRDPRAASITVAQILDHSSGIPDTTDYAWDHPDVDDGALERLVASLADRELVDLPGKAFHYSNLGYDLLGRLVEVLTGKSFERAVSEEVLEPLGVDATFDYRVLEEASRATGHVLDDGGAVKPSSHYPFNRAHAPCGTMVLDATQLARWGEIVIGEGAIEGRRLLSADLATRFTRGRRETGRADGSMTTFGFMVRGHPVGGDTRAIGHWGGDVGFRAGLWALPAHAIVVALLTSFDGAAVLPIVTAALNAALDRPIEPNRPHERDERDVAPGSGHFSRDPEGR